MPKAPEGMNPDDWVMLVLDVDQYTPQNLDRVIELERRFREAVESGTKLKKTTQPKDILVTIGLKKPSPPLRIRRVM